MREGSLEAPRARLAGPEFYDAAKLEAEMCRVFDVCHGCRRCFNLCDSFPRLFLPLRSDEQGRGGLGSALANPGTPRWPQFG